MSFFFIIFFPLVFHRFFVCSAQGHSYTPLWPGDKICPLSFLFPIPLPKVLIELWEKIAEKLQQLQFL